ncbi:protein kinase [Actinokineospora auranticolor]|uniref:serine/threonine-protein kinase n=1 Tax=Actinokineospora auranticolor TaxID=155976 RepID=UPI000CEC75C1|nr:serine/threonine-protein kinase [Actinokineospora auranticolor]
MSEREQPGRVIDGRFELLGRLGSGGMGTVWRARDLGLHREVAIKEVRPSDALHENNPTLAEQQRQRVLRESRALARLQHPNVVSIYQIIESADSKYPWIVMELVRGTSLDARLAEGPLTPPEAAHIGRGVLGALRAAHAAGVMHRDVKPGNVLLRLDGSAVLTDFGIANLHDHGQLTATGEVIGSPEYIAPERLLGDETKTASDFWSLAMLLYVAVEGYHPLRRATTMATLAAVMTDQVPPARRAGPALGAALAAVLISDPNARPSGEVLDRMLAAAEHGAVPYLGPPTPAGPAFPAQPTPTGGFPAQPGYQQPGWQQQHPVHKPSDSGSRPLPMAPPRKRATPMWSAVAAVAVAFTVAIVLITVLNNKDDQASPGSGDPDTPSASQPKATGAQPKVTKVSEAGGEEPTDEPTTTTTAPKAEKDLLTPAGARSVVGALTEVMHGSKVAELTIYGEYAMATAPTTAVKNGFDKFEYRNGVATRRGADGVDADQVLIDLNKVNWDALPALWERANKDLNVPKPEMRYIIVDSDIIDGTPSLRLYVNDEYGSGYLSATLDGKVTKLYPRE